MADTNWSMLPIDNTTNYNPILEINTSTPLIATKIFFASLSIITAFILLYICYERILCISHDFLDMLFCLILCDMMTVTGSINNCVYYYGLVEIGLVNACDAAIFCEAPSLYSTYFYVAGQFWAITIEACCFFVMLKNSVTFSLSKRTKIILHATFWTIPGIISFTAFGLHVFGFSTSRTASTFCWITSCHRILNHYQQFAWMMLTGKGLDVFVYFSIVNLVFMMFFLKTRKERRRGLEWADIDENTPTTQFRVMTSTVYGALPSIEGDSETITDEEVQNALDPGWRMFVWIPVCCLASRLWGSIRFGFDAYELFHFSLPLVFQKINATLLYMQAIGDGSIVTCKFIMVLILRKEARDFCTRPFRRLKAYIERRTSPEVNSDGRLTHSKKTDNHEASIGSQPVNA